MTIQFHTPPQPNINIVNHRVKERHESSKQCFSTWRIMYATYAIQSKHGHMNMLGVNWHDLA